MGEPSRILPAFGGCGIEIEYMMVDRQSFDIRPIADEALRGLGGVAFAGEVICGDLAWSNELALHVLELNNPEPRDDLDVLAGRFADEVQHMNALLENFGACLMPTAMHPWMDPSRETHLWPYAKADIYRAYQRIFGCRAHGEANLQSMQVNLPFAGDDEFDRLHAAIRVLLPILPALAASSPIADGVSSGCMDFRMACYGERAIRIPSLVGRIIPEPVHSREEYERRILAPMYDDIAPYDPEGTLRYEWLNARGAIARFDRSAIEIRVIDTQECPQADIAIAAAATAVTRALYEERWSGGDAQSSMSTDVLADLLTASTVNGEAAIIDDPDYLSLFGLGQQPCTAHVLWRRLIEAMPVGQFSEAGADVMDAYLRGGTLARRILRAVGPECKPLRIREVYRELCNCLAENRVFVGAATEPR